MRNPISLFLSVLFIFLFVGCNEEEDEKILVVKRTGTLTVHVTDKHGIGISNATFYVNNSTNGSIGSGYYHLIEKMTDESGMINSLELIEGQYQCAIYVERENIIYNDIRIIQVLAGEDTIEELKPFDNVGDMSVHFTNLNEDIDIEGLNIALLDKYYNNCSFEELIKNAGFIEKIDKNGKVNFRNVPQGYYRYLVYNDNKEWMEIAGYCYIYKDKEMHYINTINYNPWQ